MKAAITAAVRHLTKLLINFFKEMLIWIIKSATVTEIYSPYLLNFSLFFPTKFWLSPTLSVPRLAGLL